MQDKKPFHGTLYEGKKPYRTVIPMTPDNSKVIPMMPDDSRVIPMVVETTYFDPMPE